MAIEHIVIPAAGRGLRMMPVSRAVPKELLPLADRPLIHYLAVEACLAGARELLFVVRKGATALQRYFEHDARLLADLRAAGRGGAADDLEWLHARGVRVRAVPQEHPRGLGDAILCARAAVGKTHFGVMLPDVWVHPPETGMPALAACFQRDAESSVLLDRVPAGEVQKYGIAATRRRPGGGLWLRGVVEKPGPATAPSRLALVGRYLLPPEIFPLLERAAPQHGGEIQLTDALAALLEEQPVQGLRCRGKVHDCGHPAGYMRAFTVATRLRLQSRPAD